MCIKLGSSKSSQRQDSVQTAMPVLSEQWQDAYSNAAGNLGPGGFNPLQQDQVDWLNQNRVDNPVQRAAISVNNDLMTNRGDLAALGSKYAPYTTAATPTSDAYTGASFMDAYKNPFDKDVIDASVNDYNTNVDRTANQMRAGRDASGAFGDRASIADAVYQGDASRGLGALVSGLRQTGFNTAAGLGQQDASRFTQNNQFNAGQELQNRSQQMGAIGAQERNVLSQSGISDAILDNVIQNNQINVDAAKNLFDIGQIGQDQYNKLVQLSQAANGQTDTGSATGSSKNSSMSVDFSPIKLLAAAGVCWVAREVYGADNFKWVHFRSWLMNAAPAWFRGLYIKHGEVFAAWVHDKPKLKRLIRAWMDSRISGKGE